MIIIIVEPARTRRAPERAVKFAAAFRFPIAGVHKILRFFLIAAMRMPKLTIALALLVLAALASAMTYTGFLVVGVLADHLGTGRVAAGLLLAALFARFPWISKGKLRIVGVLPQPVRRPLMVGLLALCLLNFLARGEYVPAAFTGFTTTFLLAYPWLRRAIFERMLSSFLTFAGRNPPAAKDDMVIDGEFREKKE
ncbi:hypothetical protein ACFSQU_09935 [Massilia sp. GCM10020059]|uniref:Uncharacterized protein n=1 Tax=Massilia agrisoli TaxID=2892444 RepID=A0ABS8IM46_9BURK|nr:hypothetical protein [Massilia agrisoli]MCC6069577.1 hypothetical protein [Massilia agrisoli]